MLTQCHSSIEIQLLGWKKSWFPRIGNGRINSIFYTLSNSYFRHYCQHRSFSLHEHQGVAQPKPVFVFLLLKCSKRKLFCFHNYCTKVKHLRAKRNKNWNMLKINCIKIIIPLLWSNGTKWLYCPLTVDFTAKTWQLKSEGRMQRQGGIIPVKKNMSSSLWRLITSFKTLAKNLICINPANKKWEITNQRKLSSWSSPAFAVAKLSSWGTKMVTFSTVEV